MKKGRMLGEATTKASVKIKQAIGILKANGVDEKNIKTTNYSVSDKYDSVSEPCIYPTTVPGVKVMPIDPCINTTSR